MIKFVSDGLRTRMVDATSGADLSKVLLATEAVITLNPKGSTAVCTLSMLPVDVVSEKTIFHALNPISGKLEPVRAIEFRDGSRVEIADDGTPSVRRL